MAVSMAVLLAVAGSFLELAVRLQTYVQNRQNILISGGTGCGKTTLLNALGKFILSARARCLEDLNNFWMAHKPQTMSELYSHLYEELELRMKEAERVGYGFDLPGTVVAPNTPKISDTQSEAEIPA
jgi:ABC-type thiamine transport system ATPase subunit